VRAAALLLLAAGAAAAAYALLPDLAGRHAAASVRRGPAGQGLVALTFDDGPHPVLTPRVLDALAAAGARATFFMVGRSVRSHPELVRRVLAEGHAVGVHTDTHRHAYTLGPAALRAEIERATAAITVAGGRAPLWFRPPFGAFNLVTVRAVARLGLRTALWSCDAGDWLPGANARAIEARVDRGLTDGAIVDLHDGGQTPAGCAAMVEALPAILARARAAGLQPVHLGALFGLPAMGAEGAGAPG